MRGVGCSPLGLWDETVEVINGSARFSIIREYPLKNEFVFLKSIAPFRFQNAEHGTGPKVLIGQVIVIVYVDIHAVIDLH